jgi:hypothetical protein
MLKRLKTYLAVRDLSDQTLTIFGMVSGLFVPGGILVVCYGFRHSAERWPVIGWLCDLFHSLDGPIQWSKNLLALAIVLVMIIVVPLVTIHVGSRVRNWVRPVLFGEFADLYERFRSQFGAQSKTKIHFPKKNVDGFTRER